jgi:purine-binding chemotaxis protein CheW
MNNSRTVVIFRLDEQRFALPLARVRRVLRAVEVTCLPDAPSIVSGVIDLQGEITPVLDMRRRLQLQEREVSVDDQFIIAQMSRRSVALVVDEVHGVCEFDPSAVIKTNMIGSAPPFIEGVIRLEASLVLIQDLEKFMSLDEAHRLDRAINRSEECVRT